MTGLTAHLLRIDCLTNLHVGSGDVNYSVIDNEVQRDPVLDLPMIHSSGVKGALREHFTTRLSESDLKRIFGADGQDGPDTNRKTAPGSYKFFDAYCLARPLRILKQTSGGDGFIRTVSWTVLDWYLGFLRQLGLSHWVAGPSPDDHSRPLVLGYPGQKLWVEGDLADDASQLITGDALAALDTLIGLPCAVVPNLSAYALPIVARNSLKDGISENLWYEEYVPHSSVFYAVLMSPGACELDFSDVVQFGGNASVGYGYCRVKEVDYGSRG